MSSPHGQSQWLANDLEFQTVAIYNGGPPGIIYEFIASCVFYWLVAASIAELASAIPSSGGGTHALGARTCYDTTR